MTGDGRSLADREDNEAQAMASIAKAVGLPEAADSEAIVHEVHRLSEGARMAAEMVKTCVGHPDREEPQVPSHFDLIQTARRERDEARAALAALRGKQHG